MKIIHCADLHLDSPMNSILPSDKAKERRNELLKYYKTMVEYAADNEIEAVLIAGDAFDIKNVSATAKNVFLDAMRSHPEISFFYLRGNHDLSFDVDDKPENLYLFSKNWTSYRLSDSVVLTGAEISSETANGLYDTLMLDNSKINIVTLHGQIGEHNSKDKGEYIALSSLKNRGIDYLALGHVHTPSKGRLDMRGDWCYPGCLAPRGFDECGEHGFVVVDIKGRDLKYKLVKMNVRNVLEVHLDVSGLDTTGVEKVIAGMLGNTDSQNGQVFSKDDMIKLVLEGSIDAESEINTDYLEKLFSDEYYLFKIKDSTSLYIDYKKYESEISLKGEFVRLVMADERLDEKRRNEILSFGLKAISGEV